jgi:hypothetical protein
MHKTIYEIHKYTYMSFLDIFINIKTNAKLKYYVYVRIIESLS